jgi:hypothetical protein
MTFKNILLFCYLVGLGICLVWVPETRAMGGVRWTIYYFVWVADSSWVNYLKIFYEFLLWTWIIAILWFSKLALDISRSRGTK